MRAGFQPVIVAGPAQGGCWGSDPPAQEAWRQARRGPAALRPAGAWEVRSEQARPALRLLRPQFHPACLVQRGGSQWSTREKRPVLIAASGDRHPPCPHRLPSLSGSKQTNKQTNVPPKVAATSPGSRGPSVPPPPKPKPRPEWMGPHPPEQEATSCGGQSLLLVKAGFGRG